MLDLKGIRKRLGRATPGKWKRDLNCLCADGVEIGLLSCFTSENEDFITHSKQDITSLLSEVDSLEAKIAAQEKQEKAWQEMCQKHVGCSMLADEFADEPHDPEGFGRYVENLSQQIASLEQEKENLRDDVVKLNQQRLEWERQFHRKDFDCVTLTHALELAGGALEKLLWKHASEDLLVCLNCNYEFSNPEHPYDCKVSKWVDALLKIQQATHADREE